MCEPGNSDLRSDAWVVNWEKWPLQWATAAPLIQQKLLIFPPGRPQPDGKGRSGGPLRLPWLPCGCYGSCWWWLPPRTWRWMPRWPKMLASQSALKKPGKTDSLRPWIRISSGWTAWFKKSVPKCHRAAQWCQIWTFTGRSLKFDCWESAFAETFCALQNASKLDWSWRIRGLDSTQWNPNSMRFRCFRCLVLWYQLSKMLSCPLCRAQGDLKFMVDGQKLQARYALNLFRCQTMQCSGCSGCASCWDLPCVWGLPVSIGIIKTST